MQLVTKIFINKKKKNIHFFPFMIGGFQLINIISFSRATNMMPSLGSLMVTFVSSP